MISAPTVYPLNAPFAAVTIREVFPCYLLRKAVSDRTVPRIYLISQQIGPLFQE